MESFFGCVPINPVNIENSLYKENWPRFSNIYDCIFSINCPFVRVSYLMLA